MTERPSVTKSADRKEPICAGLSDVNYSCRSATIILAGWVLLGTREAIIPGRFRG
jgi:hypothetical protein